MTIDELRRVIESRPADRLALELIPEYPGRSGGVLPLDRLANAGPRQVDAAP